MGQKLYDLPMGTEFLHQLLIKLMATVIESPILLVNVYFAIGFMMVGAVATLVLMRLQIKAPIAAGLGVLYALAPYHLARGVSHLYLSNYFCVPLACYVAVRIAEGVQFEGGWRSKRLLAYVAVGFLTAISNSYYSFFTFIL